eukprot:PhF_6_TR33723/c0_g1_i1/m.49525
MFFRTFRRLDFRTQKLSELAAQVIKKKEEYDHIAFDVGDLVSNSLRAREMKNLKGAERTAAYVKHLVNNYNNIMKKVTSTKSTLLLFDGAEGLWKLRKIRTKQSKKTDVYVQRSGGSPIIIPMEDKIQYQLLARQSVNELMFSGMCVPGCAELKMSQWAYDMACRSDVTKNDTFCFIGSSQLYLNLLGVLPFHNLTAIKWDMGDFKIMSLQGMLEYLDLGPIVESGDMVRLGRIRTDFVFVLLLAEGWHAGDLPEIHGLNFKDMIQSYHDTCIAGKRYLFSNEDGKLALDCGLLEVVLQKCLRSGGGKGAKADHQCSDYLEVALQCHSIFCQGQLPNPCYASKAAFDGNVPNAGNISLEAMIMHLRATKEKQMKASENPEVMTAAEYMMAISNTPGVFEETYKAYANGASPPAGLADSILKLQDAQEVVKQVREILISNDTLFKTRVISNGPTHLWLRAGAGVGPPPGFVYYAVNLGQSAIENEIWSRTFDGDILTETEGIKFQKTDVPQLCGFDRENQSWVSRDPITVGPDNHYPSTFTVITWNVQFNRYTGQQTPLGRPGIDWCSDIRYIALARVIAENEPDVVVMQECEAPWWRYLSEQSWVQDKYYFSCNETDTSINPWGSMMLVNRRLGVTALTSANIGGFSGHRSIMPCLGLQVTPKTQIQVFGVHLMAPFTNDNNDNRKNQVQNLVKRLEHRYSNQPLLLLGDFNDFPTSMMEMPPSLGLTDVWNEIHGTEAESQVEAYTINGDRNKYCSLIIEPDFFGRADRLYYRCKALKPIHAELIGTKSVRDMGIDNCPEYLFPSDHFGILARFGVNQKE